MSGSGKTTVARGLMALFTRQGLTVQPFKCGPDYIDTKFHEAVCGCPSINLDTFMASPAHVRALFARYAGFDASCSTLAFPSSQFRAGCGSVAAPPIPDVCIVEGMMGLYDGYDRTCGSSYEIACVLGLPIVLVVDARSAAYSMAALLSGFMNFRPVECAVVGNASEHCNRRPVSQRSEALPTNHLRNQIVGVIYNKVGSERHAALLRQVCDDLGVPCLGCIPKSTALEQSSRYLGLDFSQEPNTEALVNLLVEHLDIEKLLLLTARVDSSDKKQPLLTPRVDGSDQYHTLPTSVLVARNAESFSFIYAEALDRLGDVRFFDPETDVPDFDGIGLLYLPGGYPEKHLDALVKNAACREAIRAYAERGGRIVAECGGMMYLCRSIVTDDVVGNASEHCDTVSEGATCHARRRDLLRYPMCGVLPYDISARREDRHLSLGYRRFTLDGREYRGHEFHYTQFIGPVPPSAAQVYDALGRPVATPVFRYKNIIASYTHLYELPLNF